MDRRIIFPTTMFVLAGLSFAFGIWQYVYAQRVQSASDARVAHILSAVDKSLPETLAAKKSIKKQTYAAIFEAYPAAPTMFGIDLSGSFASQQIADQCLNDGQRSICRALKSQHTDATIYANVCGTCNP